MNPGSDYELLKNEYQVVKRKLQSKCEALLILSQELDQCRSEKDQFRLMADQLRSRYQMLKRQSAGLDTDKHVKDDFHNSNACNQLEVEQLKQKLLDALGDIKLLREQIGRQRVGTSDEGMNTRHFPAHEREDLVKQLEVSRKEFVQMERDLQQVLDEKEELVTERDVYKNKYERLNVELNYILKGDEKRIVDVDALSMENKFLKERLKQMEEEKSMAMATLSKYKHILERKRNKGILKFGESRSGGVVITQKQVEQLLQTRSSVVPSHQTMVDLQTLAGALLDTVNDKNLALSHQRKTNKLLGNRVSELEKKLKTLEVSGLWNVNITDKLISSEGEKTLQCLQSECLDLKAFANSCDLETASILSESVGSVESTPERKPSHFDGSLNLDELDLLPTRESSNIIHSSVPPVADPRVDGPVPVSPTVDGTLPQTGAGMDNDLCQSLVPNTTNCGASGEVSDSASDTSETHLLSTSHAPLDDCGDHFKDMHSDSVGTKLVGCHGDNLMSEVKHNDLDSDCSGAKLVDYHQGLEETLGQMSGLLNSATDNLCRGDSSTSLPDEEINSSSPLLPTKQ